MKVALGFLSIFMFSAVSWSEEIGGQFSKVGDTTHLEFTGAKSWKYNLRREGSQIVVNLPSLNNQTKAHLSSWKDGIVRGVNIEPGPDGGDQVTFSLAPQAESFDYLTDQPSRLVLDFYKTETKVVSESAAPKAATKPAKKMASKQLPMKKRAPASEILAIPKGVEPGPSKSAGVFDAADPDYERFNILDADIDEKAIIASSNNVYLLFPIYEYPTPLLSEMVSAPPIYEVKPEDTDENKKVRLLLTLYNKKRAGVFMKTLEFFQKDYPKSKYDELVRYMEADIYYDFYRESKNPLDLEKALSRYLVLAEQYPDSPLAERSILFSAYSYFDRGDYLNTMKVLTRFEKRFPNSKFIHQIRLTLADTHKLSQQPEAALKVLESIENDPNAGDVAKIAAFKKGDVYFGTKNYARAISEYKKYAERFPDFVAKMPNMNFNLAESHFWLGQYRASIDAHRGFVRLFPSDKFGGYSITRIGELLEIMGAPKKKVDGAYLESMFRYQGTEGANVAKVRMTTARMGQMKEKELKPALEEIQQWAEQSKLPKAREFATILISDGYGARHDYKTSLDLLIKFYKDNPAADLEIFKKRIRDNIVQRVRTHVEKEEFIDTFKIYGEYVAVWLKNNDRIDLEYYLGRSFEQAGVKDESANYYRKVLNRLYAIQGTNEEKERRVLEDIPSTETVNLRLAALTVSQKDFAKAAFYLDSIKVPSKLSPEEQVERIELAAVVADERGQSEVAIKNLKDLIESWKGKPSLVSGPLLRLAELQIKAKEYEQAELNLEKILNLDSDSKQVPDSRVIRTLEAKAELLKTQKKNKEAIATYRKLLDRYDSSSQLDSVRYEMGKLQFEGGNLTDAEKTWSALKQESFWGKMAKEQMENSRWQQQYKKYLKRIPAMANSK